MKKALTTLTGLFVFIFLVTSGFVLIIPKDKLTDIVRPMPVISHHTETIIYMKNNINAWGAYFIEDIFYTASSTWRDIINFSLTNRTQKIIIELKPNRTKNSGLNEHQPKT